MVWCAAFDRATTSTIIARRTNRARCHVRDCSNSGSGDQQYGGESSSRHHGPSVMMILKNQLDMYSIFFYVDSNHVLARDVCQCGVMCVCV